MVVDWEPDAWQARARRVIQCAKWSDNGSLRVGREAGTSTYGSGKVPTICD